MITDGHPEMPTDHLFLGIVGTAGRKGCMQGHGWTAYETMIHHATQFIERLPSQHLHLVSGGAAWADHLAVTLFYTMREKRDMTLVLYLPAMVHDGRYYGSLDADTANYYHWLFSQAVFDPQATKNGPLPSINQIEYMETIGAQLCVIPGGFKDRNTYVSRYARHVLLAYTWGLGNEPAEGGTADTWRKSQALWKHHQPLGSLLSRPSSTVLSNIALH